jgi:hypothetical protein
VSSTTPSANATPELRRTYDAIRREAIGLAGGPGDMPPRVALLHTIFADSNGNHAFPEVALHGALWAYGFYERRGTVSRAIAYRYFYDADERARRSYMLFEFSQGFKEANRSVFVDTYANYVFSKHHGEEPGADEIIAPALLEELNRVHHAARDGRRLTPRERARVFEQALLFEQELTVGPKIREEVAKFDCPILSAIVLRPVVRFSYFPRTTYLTFANFGSTEERIEKAVRSYDLAERVGWPRVGSAIQRAAVLPQRFFERPRAYADELADAASVARPLAL